jgi:hypothetical protein
MLKQLSYKYDYDALTNRVVQGTGLDMGNDGRVIIKTTTRQLEPI